MPNYSTNLKTWGDAGSEYPDNYSYIEGEQPVDDWDNFVNSNIINDIEHLINVTNSAITLSAGDGLDGGGDVELTESISLSVDVSDFAGAGVQDDGTNNLQLTNDSLTVSAGDGLDGGGTVSLGGSLSVSVDPSDFAGSGLEENASSNLQLVNDAVTYNAGGGLSGGGQVSLGGSGTISHADTSTQADVTTGGATVIDDIYVDGYGHVDNINTQNRSLDDWGAANANISLGGNDLTSAGAVQFSNTEDVSGDGEIAYDASEGLLWGFGGQTYVVWSRQSTNAGSNISLSGGIGAGGGNTTISVSPQGSGSGLNADTVDGQDAADLTTTSGKIQYQSSELLPNLI